MSDQNSNQIIRASADKPILVGNKYYTREQLQNIYDSDLDLQNFANTYGISGKDYSDFIDQVKDITEGLIEGKYSLDDYSTLKYTQDGAPKYTKGDIYKKYRDIRKNETDADGQSLGVRGARDWKREKELRNYALNFVLKNQLQQGRANEYKLENQKNIYHQLGDDFLIPMMNGDNFIGSDKYDVATDSRSTKNRTNYLIGYLNSMINAVKNGNYDSSKYNYGNNSIENWDQSKKDLIDELTAFRDKLQSDMQYDPDDANMPLISKFGIKDWNTLMTTGAYTEDEKLSKASKTEAAAKAEEAKSKGYTYSIENSQFYEDPFIIVKDADGNPVGNVAYSEVNEDPVKADKVYPGITTFLTNQLNSLGFTPYTGSNSIYNNGNASLGNGYYLDYTSYVPELKDAGFKLIGIKPDLYSNPKFYVVNENTGNSASATVMGGDSPNLTFTDLDGIQYTINIPKASLSSQVTQYNVPEKAVFNVPLNKENYIGIFKGLANYSYKNYYPAIQQYLDYLAANAGDDSYELFKKSKDSNGNDVYSFVDKNGPLLEYTIIDQKGKKQPKRVIQWHTTPKGQLGLKVAPQEAQIVESTPIEVEENRTPSMSFNKEENLQEQFDKGQQFTNTDKIRFGSALTDLVSATGGFIPGLNIASAVVGAGSSVGEFSADLMDLGNKRNGAQSFGSALGEFALNLGMDLVSLIPAGKSVKAAKAIKTMATYVPRIAMLIQSGKILLNEEDRDKALSTLGKLGSLELSKLDTQDLYNISFLFRAISGGINEFKSGGIGKGQKTGKVEVEGKVKVDGEYKPIKAKVNKEDLSTFSTNRGRVREALVAEANKNTEWTKPNKKGEPTVKFEAEDVKVDTNWIGKAKTSEIRVDDPYIHTPQHAFNSEKGVWFDDANLAKNHKWANTLLVGKQKPEDQNSNTTGNSSNTTGANTTSSNTTGANTRGNKATGPKGKNNQIDYGVVIPTKSLKDFKQKATREELVKYITARRDAYKAATKSKKEANRRYKELDKYINKLNDPNVTKITKKDLLKYFKEIQAFQSGGKVLKCNTGNSITNSWNNIYGQNSNLFNYKKNNSFHSPLYFSTLTPGETYVSGKPEAPGVGTSSDKTSQPITGTEGANAQQGGDKTSGNQIVKPEGATPELGGTSTATETGVGTTTGTTTGTGNVETKSETGVGTSTGTNSNEVGIKSDKESSGDGKPEDDKAKKAQEELDALIAKNKALRLEGLKNLGRKIYGYGLEGVEMAIAGLGNFFKNEPLKKTQPLLTSVGYKPPLQVFTNKGIKDGQAELNKKIYSFAYDSPYLTSDMSNNVGLFNEAHSNVLNSNYKTNELLVNDTRTQREKLFDYNLKNAAEIINNANNNRQRLLQKIAADNTLDSQRIGAGFTSAKYWITQKRSDARNNKNIFDQYNYNLAMNNLSDNLEEALKTTKANYITKAKAWASQNNMSFDNDDKLLEGYFKDHSSDKSDYDIAVEKAEKEAYNKVMRYRINSIYSKNGGKLLKSGGRVSDEAKKQMHSISETNKMLMKEREIQSKKHLLESKHIQKLIEKALS